MGIAVDSRPARRHAGHGPRPRPADGGAWRTAFTTIHAAIDAALQAGGGQVWVAAGTYNPPDSNDRSASFTMREGVGIYGGFSGEEQTLEDRDWEANRTILSGDIGTLYLTDDNCYHVFYHPANLNLDPNAILDGFTIAAGNANFGTNMWDPNTWAGGMYNENSSPTITPLGCNWVRP